MIERANVVLPHPDSPASARISPSADGEIHTVDRSRHHRVLLAAEQPGTRRERDVQILDLQQGGVSIAASPACTASRRRSSASPPSRAGLGFQQDARRDAIRGERDRRRVDLRCTAACACGAPRVERAPGRQLPWIGRIAVQARPAIAGRPRPRSCGNDPANACEYGCRGSVKTCAAGPASTMRPAYITATRSLTSREHRQVVGDEQHRQPHVALQFGEQRAAPAPAPSRRARSWVRRRSPTWARTPGPSRSSRAASGRRRTRAGSLALGAAADPPAPRETPPGSSASFRVGDVVGDDGFHDLVADPDHRIQRVLGTLEDDRTLRPPHGTQVVG